ncbi:DUF721 domain-containing protein [Bacteroidota bacterium]
MRRKNTQTIAKVIQDYLKELRIDKKIKEISIVNQWEDIIGKTISRSTKEIYIKDKKLFIYLKSAVVRNELLIIREGIIKAINDRAGEEIINEIILK